MKNVLIIGGTSGIGRSFVLKCISERNNVTFLGRDEVAGYKILDLTSQKNCKFIKIDISKNDSGALMDLAIKDHKKFDLVLNFAGIMHLSYLENREIKDWQEMIDVNTKGLLTVVNSILPKMAEGGRFINISSVAALSPSVGNTVYAASKIASDTIIDGLRKEYSSRKVIFSTVHLGGVDSDINEKINNPLMKRLIKARTKTYTPLKKEIVADIIYDICALDSSINVADMFITPSDQSD